MMFIYSLLLILFGKKINFEKAGIVPKNLYEIFYIHSNTVTYICIHSIAYSLLPNSIIKLS